MDLEVYQMDVKATFLCGELKEKIYIDQPASFEIKVEEGKVWKLK